MATAERPWSAVVRVDDVPETGRHVELEASEEIRAALAAPAGLNAIDRLTAVFDLSRRGRDGLRVRGHVRANVRQTCVVTLEPLTNTIDEPIDVDFAPPQDIAPPVPDADETHLVPTTDEAEPLVDGAADLALLATEFLILAIDPYPRKKGAAFERPAAEADPTASPFAALAGWKKNDTVKK